MNIRTFVEHQILSEGQSIRLDCPSCGSKHTLSITKEMGELKFMCYKASCRVKGIINKGLTTDDLLSITKKEYKEEKFILPDFIKSLKRSIEATDYIKFYGLYKAYEKELCDIRYDIKNNRVVFVIYNEQGKICDAAGRALSKGTTPKWLRYGSSKYPFVCGKQFDTCIVVEDAPSAARVALSGSYCGVALMGTNVSLDAMRVIRTYSRSYIALDFDAALKGLDKTSSMSWFCNSNFLYLHKDIKDMSDEEFDIMTRSLNETRANFPSTKETVLD